MINITNQLSMPDASGHLKIQVCMPGMPWADLSGADHLESYSAACQWLAEHNTEKLQREGVNFRIMPQCHPCWFMVELVKNGEAQ